MNIEKRHNVKREKPIIQNEDFFYGEDIDARLCNEFGVSFEELDNDLIAKFSLDNIEFSNSDFCLIDGVCVSGRENVEGEDTVYICDYLNSMEPGKLWEIWNKRGDARDNLANLIRYPGGLHEWLMVSALPMIREMGISIRAVKELTTPTVDCSFVFNGKKCFHGGTGSTTMHLCLYKCISDAYQEYKAGGTDISGLDLIGQHLKLFVDIFYPNELRGQVPIPSALSDLVGGQFG